MRNKLFFLLIGLGILLFLGFLSCCDDCDDCPTCPEEPTAGSYYVYIADINYFDKSVIWVVDSGPDSVIDSITLAPYIRKIDVSPDGKYLAASMSSDSILIINLETKEIISTIVHTNQTSFIHPFFSNNSTELIISSFYTSIPVSKYDIISGQLIATDSFSIELQGKTITSPYVYGNREYPDSLEYLIYDYNNMILVKKFVVRRADGSDTKAVQMAISPDERYAYFIVRPDKIFKYDLNSNFVVDSVIIISEAYQGYPECTYDGKYLLVTERSEPLTWLPLGNLIMIKTDEFEIVRRICSYGYNPFYPTWPADPGELAVLPDGSRAYAVSNNHLGQYAPTSYNLIDFTATMPINIPFNCAAEAVAIGKEIKRE